MQPPPHTHPCSCSSVPTILAPPNPALGFNRLHAVFATCKCPFSALQVIEDYKEKLQLRTDHHMG